jgi:hypothetical protein
VRTAAPTLTRLLAPLALAALLAAGCGDDGGDELSADEVADAANEICEEGDEQMDEVADDILGDGSELPSDDAIRSFADAFEENIVGQMDEIDELDGPDDVDAELDDILEEARGIAGDLADQVRDDPRALFTDQGEDPFADVDERLDELGITACAD